MHETTSMIARGFLLALDTRHHGLPHHCYYVKISFCGFGAITSLSRGCRRFSSLQINCCMAINPWKSDHHHYPGLQLLLRRRWSLCKEAGGDFFSYPKGEIYGLGAKMLVGLLFCEMADTRVIGPWDALNTNLTPGAKCAQAGRYKYHANFNLLRFFNTTVHKKTEVFDKAFSPSPHSRGRYPKSMSLMTWHFGIGSTAWLLLLLGALIMASRRRDFAGSAELLRLLSGFLCLNVNSFEPVCYLSWKHRLLEMDADRLGRLGTQDIEVVCCFIYASQSKTFLLAPRGRSNRTKRLT